MNEAIRDDESEKHIREIVHRLIIPLLGSAGSNPVLADKLRALSITELEEVEAFKPTLAEAAYIAAKANARHAELLLTRDPGLIDAARVIRFCLDMQVKASGLLI